ncbi:MAG: hypothetical protein IJP04_02905, partial [Clostridia bacterium]|nr:hypothetical protein [Clostridia bacterium]
MKRTALIAVVMVLALSMAISGTIAYLTDTDSDVNVMTLGNVKIDQVEYQRVVDEDGKWVSTGEADKYGFTPEKVEEFTNHQPLYPAYFADGKIMWDDRATADGKDHYQSWAQVGAPGASKLFDDSVKGVLDKFVFVKNEGSSDAFVRTWFAFEQGDLSDERFDEIIGINYNGTHWKWNLDVASQVELDGSKYFIMNAVYVGSTDAGSTGILANNTVSYPSLLQVYMAPEATNDDVKAIDGNGNGVYEVLVFTQAMQTKNFENVAPADA